MLSNVILATAVLASAPLAQAIGSAVVKNGCNYPVKLSNVPSANGGFSEIDQSLQPGATYSQQYTQLTNGNGWSIKLSPDSDLVHIIQYEYTFHNDGTIWYDLSEVDGNPWDGNWEITATNGCTPRQAAYRYSTDDAYGMQSCNDDATITVLLCSGESQNDGAASSLASAAPSATAAPTTSAYVAPTSTYVAPASSADPVASGVALVAAAGGAISEGSSDSDSVVPVIAIGESAVKGGRRQRVANSPTTLATVASTTTADSDFVTVTSIIYEYATETAFVKRHEHHAHPHMRV